MLIPSHIPIYPQNYKPTFLDEMTVGFFNFSGRHYVVAPSTAELVEVEEGEKSGWLKAAKVIALLTVIYLVIPLGIMITRALSDKEYTIQSKSSIDPRDLDIHKVGLSVLDEAELRFQSSYERGRKIGCLQLELSDFLRQNKDFLPADRKQFFDNLTHVQSQVELADLQNAQCILEEGTKESLKIVFEGFSNPLTMEDLSRVLLELRKYHLDQVNTRWSEHEAFIEKMEGPWKKEFLYFRKLHQDVATRELAVQGTMGDDIPKNLSRRLYVILDFLDEGNGIELFHNSEVEEDSISNLVSASNSIEKFIELRVKACKWYIDIRHGGFSQDGWKIASHIPGSVGWNGYPRYFPTNKTVDVVNLPLQGLLKHLEDFEIALAKGGGPKAVLTRLLPATKEWLKLENEAKVSRTFIPGLVECLDDLKATIIQNESLEWFERKMLSSKFNEKKELVVSLANNLKALQMEFGTLGLIDILGLNFLKMEWTIPSIRIEGWDAFQDKKKKVEAAAVAAEIETFKELFASVEMAATYVRVKVDEFRKSKLQEIEKFYETFGPKLLSVNPKCSALLENFRALEEAVAQGGSQEDVVGKLPEVFKELWLKDCEYRKTENHWFMREFHTVNVKVATLRGLLTHYSRYELRQMFEATTAEDPYEISSFIHLPSSVFDSNWASFLGGHWSENGDLSLLSGGYYGSEISDLKLTQILVHLYVRHLANATLLEGKKDSNMDSRAQCIDADFAQLLPQVNEGAILGWLQENQFFENRLITYGDEKNCAVLTKESIKVRLPEVLAALINFNE